MTLEEARKIIARENGKKGGTARAKKYSLEKLQEWGRKGGRPVDKVKKDEENPNNTTVDTG